MSIRESGYHAVLVGELEAAAGEIAATARGALWPALALILVEALDGLAADGDVDGEPVETEAMLRAIGTRIAARVELGNWR